MDQIVTFVFPIARRDFILPALGSLYTYTPYNFSVVIVDQTIPDIEFETRLRKLCNVHIKPRNNLGFAMASNLGMRIAPTEYVAVVNDDVLFIPNPYPNGWFEGILRTFEKFETAAAVNAASPRDPGWAWGEEGFREYLSLEECYDPSNIQRLIDERKGAVHDAVPCWCTVFKRERLEEIGYFDERFKFGGGEDYDFDARCYQAGYRALGTTLSWCWHWWGMTKDEPDGFNVALPNAGEPWNKLSTKGFGNEGLWHPDCSVWGHNCERTDPNVARMPL